MRFSTVVSASAVAGAAFAADHAVIVGKTGLTFEPNNVTAAMGDTVTFKFWPSNHSVAAGAFATPCEPMDAGFWSGYIPSTSGAATETYSITINDTSKPIWFYCTQAKHCASGMVGVINQATTGNKTIEAYATAAKAFGQKAAEPKSAAGFGGMLMANGSMSSSNSSSTTGAASTLQVSGLSFAGMLAVFAYNLL